MSRVCNQRLGIAVNPQPWPVGIRRSLTLALAIALLTGPSSAATVTPGPVAQYGFHSWHADDGLPHTIVQAITQTDDGYIWVGTREGLARFNGHTFVPVVLPVEGVQPTITALCQGSRAQLWIGTTEDGLFCLTPSGVRRIDKDDQGDPIRRVTALHLDKEGVLLVGTSQNLCRIPSEEGALPREIFQQPVWDIAPWNDKILAVCHSLVAVEGDQAVPFEAGDEPPRAVMREAWGDPAGPLWLGNRDGLTRIAGGQSKFFQKGEGPPAIVSKILRDSAGELWLGTYGGLWRWRDGEFDQPAPSASGRFRVYDLLEDHEQGLWVASDDGLWRLARQPFKTFTVHDGLSQHSVVSVCESRSSVLLGVWGGGVDRIQDNRVITALASNDLKSEFVLGIYEEENGRQWIGYDYEGGFDVWRNGNRKHFEPLLTGGSAAVVAFERDSKGRMWVGMRHGLCLVEDPDGLNKPTLIGSGFKVNTLRSLSDGAMLVGSDAGPIVFRGDRRDRLAEQHPLLDTPILSVLETDDGVLWFGTRGKGLVRFDGESCYVFNTGNGLPDNSIFSILEDGQGRLWLSGSRTICSVSQSLLESPQNERLLCNDVMVFNRQDGVIGIGQFSEPTQPTACKTGDGKLWFRTTQGVAVVDPHGIQRSTFRPPVKIERIVANGREAWPIPDSAQVQSRGEAVRNVYVDAATPETELRIEPGRGDIDFQFAALSYDELDKARYRFRLSGIDDVWTESRGNNHANYRNLAPGDYQFEVTAANHDGVWNKQSVVSRFKLLPHFWQTLWFRAFCVLAFATTLTSAVIYAARRRLRRKLERLEQQHAVERERARIARDMHDELGAKLTQISFQGAAAIRTLKTPEVASMQIGRMVNTSRDLVASLDEIVWAVDPQNDSLEDLATYICRCASEMLDQTNINCQFHIATRLPDQPVSTEVRYNVYLAFKEALNNAVKHSNATQIDIGLRAGPSELEVWLSDNGRGLPCPDVNGSPPESRRRGHGLQNMAERMRSVSGSCDIQSQPGQGATVRFVAPIAPS